MTYKLVNIVKTVIRQRVHIYISSPRLYSTMDKPKVYITKEINKEALEILNKHCEVTSWTGPDPVPRTELIKNITDKSALLCMLCDKIDKGILDHAPQLKVISTMSVGYDHLDLQEIISRQIKVGYTPDILTDATAELTVALLLATSRRLMESSEEVKNGGWSAWSPFWMCGPGLKGSTVGIVGFGRIGQEVAKRLKSFKPKKIIFINRSPRSVEATEIGATRVEFPELLTESDFVVCCCSLTPGTTNLFNREAFKLMKKTAVFVNTGRGAVVDQQALVEALEKKIIWGAGLDVMVPEPLPTDSPLLKLKNCVVLPHIGSASIETRNEMGLLAARNVLAALKDEVMPASLNLD